MIVEYMTFTVGNAPPGVRRADCQVEIRDSNDCKVWRRCFSKPLAETQFHPSYIYRVPVDIAERRSKEHALAEAMEHPGVAMVEDVYGGVAHSDHPLRHHDRTCPGCEKEADEARLRSAVDAACSCGGRGPEDDCCQACEVWHRMMGTAPPKIPSSGLYPLFEHMAEEHSLTLLDTELREIVNIVRRMERPS